MEEDILKQETKMRERHAKELSELGANKEESNTTVDGLVKDLVVFLLHLELNH